MSHAFWITFYFVIFFFKFYGTVVARPQVARLLEGSCQPQDATHKVAVSKGVYPGTSKHGDALHVRRAPRDIIVEYDITTDIIVENTILILDVM